MLKAGVIWLIGTDGSGHNELASCVPSRRSMPINQMTPAASDVALRSSKLRRLFVYKQLLFANKVSLDYVCLCSLSLSVSGGNGEMDSGLC
ncbi:hypothetical protein TYRP_005578, partial [Tyrophagus putrescentiae]